MAEYSEFIPKPIKSLEHLSELLSFWNEEVCKKDNAGEVYIHGVVLGIEGPDTGRNVVWYKDSKTEPLAPVKLAEFPILLTKEERRKKIGELETAGKLELRSVNIVLFADGEKKWVALFDAAAPSAPSSPAPENGAVSVKLSKAFARVSNRGKPSNAFLEELVEWAKTAPAEIFEARQTREPDVYASVEDDLGPYTDLLHRKACMLEVMRVLAGFESSWDWMEGIDKAKAKALKKNARATEAGAWQVSADSVNFGKDLKDLVAARTRTIPDPERFQDAMKTDHLLAMEYIARLLRHTIRHNGPVKRHEIDDWLSKDAVTEFKQLLTA